MAVHHLLVGMTDEPTTACGIPRGSALLKCRPVEWALIAPQHRCKRCARSLPGERLDATPPAIRVGDKLTGDAVAPGATIQMVLRRPGRILPIRQPRARALHWAVEVTLRALRQGKLIGDVSVRNGHNSKSLVQLLEEALQA